MSLLSLSPTYLVVPRSPTAGRPYESAMRHDADDQATGAAAILPGMQRNVLGEQLEECSVDPMTGWFRDGSCRTDDNDRGSHTICVFVTAEFLEHQRSIGNDLTTPMARFSFPGLVPGDRWCVTAPNWLRAHDDGAAAPVVLGATNERVLSLIPLEILEEHAVDVPADPGSLDG